ncbi:RICIN domain-containing protein [Streptomyces buecherae]|uniref:RICIN domain-containing protein n=1 Tax=Streptomyces buecherae TaxID=2763006 RepID=A0A7H8N948_9ACTN|nr:RICIN domain-containing protein [Streptomyces buecherae]QKW50995.1 RICIN domain-containing protein [Streptomyces buecherae]
MAIRMAKSGKVAAAALFLFAAASTTTAAAVENDRSSSRLGTWTWYNHNSGKCLEIHGGGTADGAGAVQWGCNGSAWQLWTNTNGGTLTEIRNGNTGKCLEVYGGGTADGAGVVQWSCNGANWQKWK